MDGIEKYEDIVKGEDKEFTVVKDKDTVIQYENQREITTGVEPNNILVAIGALGVLLTLGFISGIYEKWKTRK